MVFGFCLISAYTVVLFIIWVASPDRFRKLQWMPQEGEEASNIFMIIAVLGQGLQIQVFFMPILNSIRNIKEQIPEVEPPSP